LLVCGNLLNRRSLLNRGSLLNDSCFTLGFAEDDATLHLWVYLTDIPKRPGLYCASIRRGSWEPLREGVGERLPRVQGLGEECSSRTGCEYGVLGSSLVDPPNRGPWLDDELGRLKVEIANGHCHHFLALRTSVGGDHQQSNGQKGNQARQSL
jgi:hypothetical protein